MLAWLFFQGTRTSNTKIPYSLMVFQGVRTYCSLSGSVDGEDDSLKGGYSAALAPGSGHDDCDVAPNQAQIKMSKS